MFIELTDHLRCPAEHAESFLVLIPDRTEGRAVAEGLLGCPVCHREYRIVDGVVDFGAPAAHPSAALPADFAEALATFMGLAGPGGYVGLIGAAGGLAGELSALVPGVHMAAVNPPSGTIASPTVSLLHSPRVPFKQRSLRSIVLSQPFAEDSAWEEAAMAAVLPGLRIVGTGKVPDVPGFDLLAEAAGWWVGRTR